MKRIIEVKLTRNEGIVYPKCFDLRIEGDKLVAEGRIGEENIMVISNWSLQQDFEYRKRIKNDK